MGQLALKVVPSASLNSVDLGPPIKVKLTARPHKGAANTALEKYLKSLTGIKVRVASGHKGRLKIIEFGIRAEEFVRLLASAQRPRH